jgi:hypothetical protein
MSDKEVYINVKDLRIKIPKNKKKQEDAPKSPMTRFYDFFCNLFTIWFC